MTETRTLTLADFLLARIAEDESVAREVVHKAEADKGRWMLLDDGPTWHCDEQSDHLAVAPARVLAECEAKRRIVALHPIVVEREWMSGLGERPDYEVEQFTCGQCGWVGELSPHGGWTGTTGCDTLRALALPYADHPDYREEWRP